jgi:Cu(I)/Ag(I) efflux system membrane fusion protein
MKPTAIVPAIVILLAACGGDHSAHRAEAPAAPQTAEAKPPATSTADALASLPEASRAPFGAMMAAYGSIQTALAADSTAGIETAAPAIAGAAKLLEANAAGNAKPHYASIAVEAEKVAANAADIAKARQSFGELSKAMLTLLVANPDLAKGRVVVECPMTSTYKKWLQTDEKVRNPYYGSGMLECGTISKLEL